jgi:CRP-like cAMP-binding protein
MARIAAENGRDPVARQPLRRLVCHVDDRSVVCATGPSCARLGALDQADILGQPSDMLTSGALPLARNRLLAALHRADPGAGEQLRAGLESVELRARAKVMSPDRPIRHVYFPETGVLSQIQQMRNGSAVEVNLIGSDGMAGLPVYLGAVTFPMEMFCQAPGVFLRMAAADFRAEVDRNPALHSVLHGYTQAILEVRAQAIGCDRFHAVEARAARWLLEMDDRVPYDEFVMTHEFLALALGVRRQTVSSVVAHMNREGWINYRRGLIRIVDRGALEGATCECYAVIRDEFARLVGPPIPRRYSAVTDDEA